MKLHYHQIVINALDRSLEFLVLEILSEYSQAVPDAGGEFFRWGKPSNSFTFHPNLSSLQINTINYFGSLLNNIVPTQSSESLTLGTGLPTKSCTTTEMM